MISLHMFSSALLMIILISLLILIHEAGHFLAAKAIGVRVDKFGFGLPVGPTLFSKKFGETEILIHAFLLGGYVSFPDDEEDSDLPADSPLRFCNKTVLQRMFVIIAGVLFNFIFAVYLVFLVGFIWKVIPVNEYDVYFKEFAPSATEKTRNAGFEQNDKIHKINGICVDYPVAVNKFFTLSKEFDGFAASDIIETKFQKLKELNPDLSKLEIIPAGTKVILPEFTDEKPVSLSSDNITGLEKYVSHEKQLSDIQINLRDSINYAREFTTVQDTRLSDIAAAISDTKKPVNIILLRSNGETEYTVVLPPLYTDKEGVLGIIQYYTERVIPSDTISNFIYIKDNLVFMFRSLYKIFTGKVPMNEMNGIIAITKIGTEIIAHQGIFRGILLTAMISLNLAIINILPIPALDGGHLMFLVIEKITGKPVGKKFVEVVNNLFFCLLVILMVFIVYNDIHAWIIGKI